MRFITYPIGLFAVLIMLSACTVPPLKNDQLLEDDSLVTGEPCAAPCWHGITPTETEWEAAIQTLEGLSMVGEVRTDDVSGDEDAQFAAFTSATGENCCEIFSDDGEVVSRILLRFAPGMLLGDMIALYGDPTYIYAAPYTNTEAVGTLVFLDVPMVVAFYLDDLETGEISAETEIIGVFISTPESVDSVISVSNLYEWNGYQPYASYAANPFDVVPVSPTPSQAE